MMTVEEKLDKCLSVLQIVADSDDDPELRDMAAEAVALEVDHKPEGWPFK